MGLTFLPPARASTDASATLSHDLSLPTEVVGQIARRIALISLITASLWMIELLLPWLLINVGGVDDFITPDLRRIQNKLSIAMLLVSLGVYALTRYASLTLTHLANLAVCFEIFVTYYTAMTERMFTSPTTALEPTGISGAFIWVLFFPAIIPMGWGRALIATGVSAAAPALMLWLLTAMGKVHPTPDFTRFTVITCIVLGLLALVPSRVLYGLSRSVQRAEEMGSYRLLSLIGRGGMGEVWRAKHRMLARPAAVKLIPKTKFRADDETMQRIHARFEREAQATAQLRSPHAVNIYDFGITEEGVFFYAMELLEGIDLDVLVEKHGAMPAERAIHLLIQMCDALDEAHQRGLIHRDIKPSNIIVTPIGLSHDHATVLDFGLVKPPPDTTTTNLTMDGALTGTPSCLAPEQALSQPIDGRADLYGLGCVAFWLLTGSLPFDSPSSVGLIAHHISTPAPQVSTVATQTIPPSLDAVIARTLAKEPADRFQDAVQMAHALRACLHEIDDPWTRARAQKWWMTHQTPTGEEHSAQT